MYPIYMVSGCKGGVGKSIVSMALLDYLIKLDRKCLLVEADTANDDVFKTYGDSMVTAHINLDIEEGWVELVNFLDANKELIAVVNFGARSNSGVRNYGGVICINPPKGGISIFIFRSYQLSDVDTLELN
jgi:nitrogenase subunit NifH